MKSSLGIIVLGIVALVIALVVAIVVGARGDVLWICVVAIWLGLVGLLYTIRHERHLKSMNN
ncbi:MAG: DUF2530 domain-containing protein [Actinomycetes bacterium]